MKAEKLYRIYDVENDKYFSTGKKSIWKSEGWAATALINAVSSSWWVRNKNLENYEIHVIEQTIAERKSGVVVVADLKKVRNEKALARERIENLQNKIERLVPKVGSYYEIRSIWKEGMFSDKLFNTLTPLFKELTELEKIAK